MSVKEDIEPVCKFMVLELDERNVNELVIEHYQELTTKKVQKLQHSDVLQEICFEYEPEMEAVIATSQMLLTLLISAIVSKGGRNLQVSLKTTLQDRKWTFSQKTP